jgi:hypothetical protein
MSTFNDAGQIVLPGFRVHFGLPVGFYLRLSCAEAHHMDNGI